MMKLVPNGDLNCSRNVYSAMMHLLQLQMYHMLLQLTAVNTGNKYRRWRA